MVGRFVDLEFLFPISDYLRTLKKREFGSDIAIPIIAAGCAYIFVIGQDWFNMDRTADFASTTINLLAILIGFSLACIAILVSGSESNIATAKKHPTKRKVGGRILTLYQLMVGTMMYGTVVEILLLLLNVVYVAVRLSACGDFEKRIFITFNFLVLLHVVVLNLRNVSNLYNILWCPEPGNSAQEKKKEGE